MAIDTLKVARRLRDAGFSEPQADAVVAAVQEGAEAADLATKGDLALQGHEQRAELAALRSEMREMEQRLIAKMEAIKAEMTTRVMTTVLSTVLVNVITILGAMFAFGKLLGH